MEVSGRRPTHSDGHTTCLFCDPCKGENENKPADAYCTVCNEYLCHGCKKAHTRLNFSEGHAFLDGGEMPKQRPTFDKGSKCLKHSDKPLDYYCKSDDQFCCSVCATIDHKQCMVQYIEDIATDFHKSNEYIALEKATADLIRFLQETYGAATRNLTSIETKHANFISDLNQFRSEINKILDSLEKEAMKVAEITRYLDRKSINLIATSCDSMLSDIQSLTVELEELNTYKQKRELMICSKGVGKTVNIYGKRVNELSNQNIIRDYKFKPNEEIRRLLHSFHNLGDMEDEKDEKEPQHGTSESTGADNFHQVVNEPAVCYVGNIDVRHSTDKKSCGITGGVLIDETKLAIVDNCNSSVKIADLESNRITACIELPTRPWDITCANQNTIVVTCNDRNKGKLVFLKNGKYLSVVKELDIGKNCQGVIFTDNTFFVVFYRPESSVKAIDINGNVLKTFKPNKDGDDLMLDPWYIGLSTDKKTVFESDWSNHTVTSLSLDGTVKHVYKEDSLKRPRGLAVDRNDNVYIAGCGSHNIHQLSLKTNRSRAILDQTNGMKYPYMVTYCKTRDRLFVSGEKGGCDEVYVYQLQ